MFIKSMHMFINDCINQCMVVALSPKPPPPPPHLLFRSYPYGCTPCSCTTCTSCTSSIPFTCCTLCTNCATCTFCTPYTPVVCTSCTASNTSTIFNSIHNSQATETADHKKIVEHKKWETHGHVVH